MKKNAIIGCVAGTLVMTVFGSAFNAIYLIPKFAQLYGLPLESIIEMGHAINPAIRSRCVIFKIAPLDKAAIIKGLKSGEQRQKEALEVLSEMLVFAEPAMLANFPGQDICKLLMNLLTNSNNSDLLILVTQSLATLLHIHSNALHWINGSRLITLVLAKMKTTTSVPLLENMIHILAFFAKKTHS